MIPSISAIHRIYLLPYNDDKNINKKLRRKVSELFKSINESYKIGFLYNEYDNTKCITVEVPTLIHDSKIDFFETMIRKFLRTKPRKQKGKRIEITI
jgi:hypothetical protein